MEIIDLTYDLTEGMTTFNAPWHPRVSITQVGRIGFEGRETRKVSFGTHTGTQVDAPLHFIEGGASVEKIPLGTLIGDVSIIDFSDLGENEEITKNILGKIDLSERMIFKFGWGKYWNSSKFYQNYPFFSRDAAEYLVSKNVKLIGMDTPSPDDSRIKLSGEILGGDKDSPIHKIFLRNDIVLVEYVANLDKVREYDGWKIIVMPLRIKGADGSPARICIYK